MDKVRMGIVGIGGMGSHGDRLRGPAVVWERKPP